MIIDIKNDKIHKKIGKNLPIFKNYVKFCLMKVVVLLKEKN